MTGYEWKFNKNTPIESGFKLIDDENLEHYTLALAKNILPDKYKRLLEKWVLSVINIKGKNDGLMEVIA